MGTRFDDLTEVAPSASRPSPRSRWMGAAALAAVYFVTAKLGLELAIDPGNATALWAPTGISLAALLLFGMRLWPGVTLGAFLANATTDVSLATTAAIAVGNTLEAVIGAYLLNRVGFRTTLERVHDVIAFVTIAGIVSTMVSATVGVTSLWLSGAIRFVDYDNQWTVWWIGDVMGNLFVATFLLVWWSKPLERNERRAVEALGLLVSLVVLGRVAFFGGHTPSSYFVFPLLIWATLRFRQHGAATSISVFAAIGVWATLSGERPFGGQDLIERIAILQGVMGAASVGTFVLAATIAERERADERREASISLLEATLDSTADGILVVDRSGKVVAFNQMFAETWGLPDDMLASGDDNRFLEYVVDQLLDPHEFLDKVRELYLSPEARSTDVLKFKDGRIVERYSQPQKIGRETVGRVWSFRDVTEQRHAEQLKATFMDMAAHELRSPVAVIVGMASTMLDTWDESGTGERRELLKAIGRQGMRLSRLLDTLLLRSQIESGKLRVRPEPLEVAHIVHGMVSELGYEDVRVTCPQGLTAVVDRQHFEHILVNYLVNAQKYGRGPVSIEVTEADGFVQLCVMDRGKGVSEKFVPLLFERFERAPESITGPGSGLGLAIVRALAEAEGGSVWYEPNSPSGARFYARLPSAHVVRQEASAAVDDRDTGSSHRDSGAPTSLRRDTPS